MRWGEAIRPGIENNIKTASMEAFKSCSQCSLCIDSKLKKIIPKQITMITSSVNGEQTLQ